MGEIISKILIAVAIYVLIGILACIPLMLLWNWLVPTIFDLPRITLLQAFGLALLTKLLFGGINYSEKKN